MSCKCYPTFRGRAQPTTCCLQPVSLFQANLALLNLSCGLSTAANTWQLAWTEAQATLCRLPLDAMFDIKCIRPEQESLATSRLGVLDSGKAFDHSLWRRKHLPSQSWSSTRKRKMINRCKQHGADQACKKRAPMLAVANLLPLVETAGTKAT